jgi:hypothetical protein
MKGIGFTFDAFGQWSEHDMSKMKWRMKVGIEWRPSMTGWPKIGCWPVTFTLLSSLLSPSLTQSPHLWDRLEELWPHGPATPWLPYKRVGKGGGLIRKAESWPLFKTPGVPTIVHRASFYAATLSGSWHLNVRTCS